MYTSSQTCYMHVLPGTLVRLPWIEQYLAIWSQQYPAYLEPVLGDNASLTRCCTITPTLNTRDVNTLGVNSEEQKGRQHKDNWPIERWSIRPGNSSDRSADSVTVLCPSSSKMHAFSCFLNCSAHLFLPHYLLCRLWSALELNSALKSENQRGNQELGRRGTSAWLVSRK